jgi:hypothetical protein
VKTKGKRSKNSSIGARHKGPRQWAFTGCLQPRRKRAESERNAVFDFAQRGQVFPAIV